LEGKEKEMKGVIEKMEKNESERKEEIKEEWE
jgi:hypothetical protein